MYSRQYRTSKSSSSDSDTSAPNQFAPRRFVVQPKTEEVLPVQEQTPKEQTQTSENHLINFSLQPRPTPSKTPKIQMKLSIGQPGDKYGQEADKIAQDVVQPISASGSESIQRMMGNNPERRQTRNSTRLQTFDRESPNTDQQGRTRGSKRTREQREAIAEGVEVAPPRRNLNSRPYSRANDGTLLWDGFTRLSWGNTDQQFWQGVSQRQGTSSSGNQRTEYECYVGRNETAWLPRSSDAESGEDIASIGHKTQWRDYILENADVEEYEVDGGNIRAISKAQAEQLYRDQQNLQPEGQVFNSRQASAYTTDALFQEWVD